MALTPDPVQQLLARICQCADQDEDSTWNGGDLAAGIRGLLELADQLRALPEVHQLIGGEAWRETPGAYWRGGDNGCVVLIDVDVDNPDATPAMVARRTDMQPLFRRVHVPLPADAETGARAERLEGDSLAAAMACTDGPTPPVRYRAACLRSIAERLQDRPVEVAGADELAEFGLTDEQAYAEQAGLLAELEAMADVLEAGFPTGPVR
jgi:hypothetical protein